MKNTINYKLIPGICDNRVEPGISYGNGHRPSIFNKYANFIMLYVKYSLTKQNKCSTMALTGKYH